MSNQASNDRPAGGSRRKFFKLRASAVPCAAVAGGLSIARSAHAAGDDTIKIALIGCGGRGTGAANNALRTKGNVKLVAMADVFEDQLAKSLKLLKREVPDQIDVPKERQFVGFDAYQKAIDAGPDLVLLTTPPGFRPIHFEAAVKAGKHVFMEKPVAVDAPGVRSVLAAAEQARQKKLAVGVGLERRHRASYQEAIQRIHSGAIGDVVYLRVYWNNAGHGFVDRDPDESEMIFQLRNWWYFNWLGGDQIAEKHVHLMDVGNWVKAAHPIQANGMGGRQVRTDSKFGQSFDHYFVEFEYPDGSRMISQCRDIPNCWDSCSEHIVGTKGICEIGEAQEARITGPHPWRYPVQIGRSGPNPYQVEHDRLLESIRSGNPIDESQYGAESTMTSILGRAAVHSGQAVTWEKAFHSDLRLIPADQRWAWDAAPPVLPDENGNYPIAVPGVSQAV
ncbi:MAG TPA: Gfo/Idh/MocA family oxidoreductase [Pirellulales bacterium]|jgi:predicted dehydrogenase|nr:Gfo/Idh/MocA family oxidoreductase [Pirellulales bacterium]